MDEGLTEGERATVRALMVPILGVPDDPVLIGRAVDRLDAYLQCIPEKDAARSVHDLLFFLRLKSRLENWNRTPEELSPAAMERFVKKLFTSEGTKADWVMDRLTKVFQLLGRPEPSIRDLAKSIREMLSLAYWTNPDTDDQTGYTPIWDRDDIWRDRTDVDGAKRPSRQPWRIDVREARSVHRVGHPYDTRRLFHGDRPGKKVAVIGSGAGGAVVARKLAEAGYDVAVFESGPRFRSHEYPLDALVGMAQLFERGLLTLNHNLDIHLLRGRLVGGSTVLTSGMSIKMGSKVLGRWNDDHGAGLPHAEMDRAFDEVKAELALDTINPAFLTEPGERWKIGARSATPDIIFDSPLVNVATKPGGHPDGSKGGVGNYCLACGLCNYGCHFGHKLSMDLTYLPAAERAGAQIHPNLPVEHLTGEWDRERHRMRVTGLVLRDLGEHVPVDHVVLAAGAVGSPALMLRTEQSDPAFGSLPPFKEHAVGRRLGFNYGTTVAARFPKDLDRPGNSSFQISYVGHRPGDDSFVLENAFIPPGLISNVVPGIGTDHYEWMRDYERLGMAVNTIGSPMKGRVYGDHRVEYRVSTDDEMDLIRETIAMIVSQFLHGGASQVGLAGVREMNDRKHWFTQEDRDQTVPQITERLRRMIPDAEHVMLSSAHPQGGLCMGGPDNQHAAVDTDFRFRGTDNLFVADASVFPETITVNPQWSVMAVATVAAERILKQL